MTPRPNPTAVPLGLLCLLGAMAWGCGYSAGGAGRGLGVRTVSVEVVGNQSFRQRYEIPLTRRILEDLPIHSDLVPAGPETADAILRVRIEDIPGVILSEGGIAPLREGALWIAASVELVDRRSGKLLREARVADRAEYRVPVGETLRDAAEEAVRDLARRVILALEPGF